MRVDFEHPPEVGDGTGIITLAIQVTIHLQLTLSGGGGT